MSRAPVLSHGLAPAGCSEIPHTPVRVTGVDTGWRPCFRVCVKTNYLLTSCALTACLSASLLIVGCASLSHELLGTPASGTVITNAVLQTQLPPPFTSQMAAASQVVAATVPGPEGVLVSTLLTLLGAGAAALATFHAGKASQSATAASGSAVSAAKSAPTVQPVSVSSAAPTKPG